MNVQPQAPFLAAWLLCLSAAGEPALLDRQPPHDAQGVCTDALLELAFNEPVSVGSSGRVQVVRVRDGKMVDSINLADREHSNVFGTKVLRYEPVRVEGNTAVVQLHARALESGTAYSVVVEPGVFLTATGSFRGIPQGNWQFTTRPALAKGRTRLEVAKNSMGDFCTLQGAVDYIPEDNFTPTEIYIRNGTYDCIAYLGPGRDRIRIRGEDRKKTIIAGRNNDKLNSGRMMRPLLSVDADDFTLENLTVRNTTPYRGSQAEALRISGQRCTVRGCDFYSFQDTLLLGGRVYVRDCYVEGDVDFIWGHGVTFFDRCELKAAHDGYYVTSRNPEDRLGFVFYRCKLTAAPGVTKCWLARIETGRFPFSAVAFINCQMGPHVPGPGWLVTGNDVARLKFYEFQSTTPEGKPVDVTQRHPASRQITPEQAADLADANRVLAANDNWRPSP